MSGAFTGAYVANTANYAIAPTAIVSSGTGALVNISSAGGTYTLDGFANQGDNYQVGDILLIQGNLLGGTSPTNDLTLRVLTLDSDTGIGTLELTGI